MNRQRTTTVLLAALVVLMAVYIMTAATPAPQEEGPTGACCIFGECFTGQTPAECAALGGTFKGIGTVCGQADAACAPAVTVVSVTVGKDAGATVSSSYRIIRGWSDGTVDLTSVTLNTNPTQCNILDSCGPVSLIPLPCPADINNDLSVNVLDLVELLLVFGVTCPS